ncbi:CBS domain-containing protein [Amycolatopsis sp. NPDC059021]|uniref:CBS domain-containing protein n=1 Tax=Amycolatopsis sp. NPDC059021 TaxID=3346704 RepID=UPI00367213F0
MRARDVMTSPVITVRTATTAKEAAEILARQGFTALPVVDDDDRLIGIVTEADLIRDRIPADPRSCHGEEPPRPREEPGLTVGALMTSPATGMSPGTDVADLTRALVGSGIRAMPVVDGARVIGIVTRGDIVRVLARDDHAILNDVRHHLEIYGGPDRWTVEVEDGVVRVVDAYDDETDRHVAALLAQSVPGVVDAQVVSEHEESIR